MLQEKKVGHYVQERCVVEVEGVCLVGKGSPPGFPTLRNLEVTAKLKMAGVMALGQPSKRESLILTVEVLFLPLPNIITSLIHPIRRHSLTIMFIEK
jgi:hypothetical protein